MDRRRFKMQAKDMIREHFLKIIGVVVLVMVLNGSSFGYNIVYDGYDVESLMIHFFGFVVYTIEMNETFYETLSYLMMVAVALNLFLFIPINYGLQKYWCNLIENKASWSDLLAGYKDGFGKIVVVNCILSVIVVAGVLLFIIPGIMILMAYYYVNMVMIRHPELGIRDTFRKTALVTKGNRMDLFLLILSFIGWSLLSAITLNILAIFVMPYIGITFTLIYNHLDHTEQKEHGYEYPID